MEINHVLACLVAAKLLRELDLARQLLYQVEVRVEVLVIQLVHDFQRDGHDDEGDRLEAGDHQVVDRLLEVLGLSVCYDHAYLVEHVVIEVFLIDEVDDFAVVGRARELEIGQVLRVREQSALDPRYLVQKVYAVRGLLLLRRWVEKGRLIAGGLGAEAEQSINGIFPLHSAQFRPNCLYYFGVDVLVALVKLV